MSELIPVTPRKYFKVCRETITPKNQEDVPGVVERLLQRLKRERTNGTISIAIAAGGVRNLILESSQEDDQM